MTTTDTGRLSFTVHLPWPPRACSPNARHGHWAVKRKADTRYRRTAEVATLRVTGGPLCCEYVLLHVQFCPPDRRRRDRDNCIAAFKGAQDGIADALRIDDSKFAVSYAPMGEPVKGGAVLVTITLRVMEATEEENDDLRERAGKPAAPSRDGGRDSTPVGCGARGSRRWRHARGRA